MKKLLMTSLAVLTLTMPVLATTSTAEARSAPGDTSAVASSCGKFRDQYIGTYKGSIKFVVVDPRQFASYAKRQWTKTPERELMLRDRVDGMDITVRFSHESRSGLLDYWVDTAVTRHAPNSMPLSRHGRLTHS